MRTYRGEMTLSGVEGHPHLVKGVGDPDPHCRHGFANVLAALILTGVGR
jgi:hypothetical protein